MASVDKTLAWRITEDKMSTVYRDVVLWKPYSTTSGGSGSGGGLEATTKTTTTAEEAAGLATTTVAVAPTTPSLPQTKNGFRERYIHRLFRDMMGLLELMDKGRFMEVEKDREVLDGIETLYMEIRDRFEALTRIYFSDAPIALPPSTLLTNDKWNWAPVLAKKDALGLLAVLRSFLSSMIEDDLSNTCDEVILKDKLFDLWRRILEDLDKKLLKLMNDTDAEFVKRIPYKFNRIVRPFTTGFPSLSLFFQKMIPKNVYLRLTIVHGKVGSHLARLFGYANLMRTADKKELGTTILGIAETYEKEIEAMITDLTTTGLDGLGPLEKTFRAEIPSSYSSLLLPIDRLDMTDIGHDNKLKRQEAKNLILLHAYQRCFLVDTFLSSYSLNDPLQEKVQRFKTASKAFYEDLVKVVVM